MEYLLIKRNKNISFGKDNNIIKILVKKKFFFFVKVKLYIIMIYFFTIKATDKAS